MTDYYSRSAVLVECSKEQAVAACNALEKLSDYCENGTMSVGIVPDSDAEPTSPEVAIMHHYYWATLGDDVDWSAEFSVEVVADGVLLHAGCGDFNANTAAVFVEAILKAFDLPDIVEMGVARLASDPEAGAFSGCVIMITKNGHSYDDGSNFVRAETFAHRQGLAYGALTQAVGDGRTETTLFGYPVGSDPFDYLIGVMGLEELTGVNVEPISPTNYAVLSRFIPDANFNAAGAP